MYNTLKDFQLAILGLLLAIGLIITAFIVSNSLPREGISVTGSAFEIVTSDNATWSFTVNTTGDLQADAYNELKKEIPIVKEYLKNNGIKDSEIEELTPNTTPTYKISPKSGYAINEIEYYNYNQTIKVTSDNVEKVKNLSSDIQSLISKGVYLTSNPPTYLYSKLPELKIKLLEDATKDAKSRADGMLKATNNRVGKIKSVKMGVFQITTKDSTEVSDYGVNDNSSVDKRVTAVANVIFEIK